MTLVNGHGAPLDPSDLAAAQEVVVPTLTIRLRPTGQPGGYRPTIEVADFPGDWGMVHEALLGCVKIAHREHAKELREQQRQLVIARQLPYGERQ